MKCSAIFYAQGLTYSTCIDHFNQVWKALILVDGSFYWQQFMGVAI